MAAGEPWWAAKYSYGVWERFANQANPFLDFFLLTLEMRLEARPLCLISYRYIAFMRT